MEGASGEGSSDHHGLTPLEQERKQFGHNLVEVRGKLLRVIHRQKRGEDTVESGDGGACVFFVHGGGGRGCQFKHQMQALENDVSVVSFDFLGHGDSPSPNNPELYTADEHLEDMYQLFNQFKAKRNIIVAHCYGTIHTLRLLKRLKDEDKLGEIAGVILLSLGRKNPVSLGLVGKLPAFVLEWLRPLARSSSNAAVFTPTTDPALIEFENSISSTNRMYVMKVVGQDCSDQDRWSGWLEVGKKALVGLPAMLLVGDSDGLFTVESSREASQFLGLTDEQFFVIKQSGHLSMLDQHEEVSRIIREFIKQHLNLI